jgi:hypothetical protein
MGRMRHELATAHLAPPQPERLPPIGARCTPAPTRPAKPLIPVMRAEKPQTPPTGSEIHFLGGRKVQGEGESRLPHQKNAACWSILGDNERTRQPLALVLPAGAEPAHGTDGWQDFNDESRRFGPTAGSRRPQPSSARAFLSSKACAKGLVDCEQRGKWAYFSLNPDALQTLAALADLKGVCC